MEYATLSDENACLKYAKLEVIPITHDELLRTLNNPFRGMTDRRVLRVDENCVEFKLIKKKLMKFNYEVKFIYTPYELEPVTLNKKDAASLKGGVVVRVHVTSVGDPPVPSTGLVPAASLYVTHPVVLSVAFPLEIKFFTTFKPSILSA